MLFLSIKQIWVLHGTATLTAVSCSMKKVSLLRATILLVYWLKLFNQTVRRKIVHDPRLVWNTFDIVEEYKGVAVQSKSGHAFIKDVMREHNAVYGGEMSAHHYFRDFAYCDSGMIPWLLTIALLSETGQSLSTLVENMIAKFPCSGEINFKVADTQTTIQKIFDFYADQNPQIDRTDGVSLDFGAWRFNVRASNTEPLLRLNIESRADRQAQPMQYYVDELTGLIQS